MRGSKIRIEEARVQRASYAAHTGGGALHMADVGCPASAAEAIAWTLGGGNAILLTVPYR